MDPKPPTRLKIRNSGALIERDLYRVAAGEIRLLEEFRDHRAHIGVIVPVRVIPVAVFSSDLDPSLMVDHLGGHDAACPNLVEYRRHIRELRIIAVKKEHTASERQNGADDDHEYLPGAEPPRAVFRG